MWNFQGVPKSDDVKDPVTEPIRRNCYFFTFLANMFNEIFRFDLKKWFQGPKPRQGRFTELWYCDDGRKDKFQVNAIMCHEMLTLTSLSF